MPKKILIIEDDPVVLKYLQAVFSDNGYATCTATSSMEGLDVVRKEKPDLITLDLQLPGEWGPRFYRKLRKDKELNHKIKVEDKGLRLEEKKLQIDNKVANATIKDKQSNNNNNNQ